MKDPDSEKVMFEKHDCVESGYRERERERENVCVCV